MKLSVLDRSTAARAYTDATRWGDGSLRRKATIGTRVKSAIRRDGRAKQLGLDEPVIVARTSAPELRCRCYERLAGAFGRDRRSGMAVAHR